MEPPAHFITHILSAGPFGIAGAAVGGAIGYLAGKASECRDVLILNRVAHLCDSGAIVKDAIWGVLIGGALVLLFVSTVKSSSSHSH